MKEYQDTILKKFDSPCKVHYKDILFLNPNINSPAKNIDRRMLCPKWRIESTQ